MQAHGRGWGSYLSAPDEKPRLSWNLMKRVLHYTYGYRWQIAAILALIMTSTGLSLCMPLLMRDLIDRTIPNGDQTRLMLLALCLLLIPAANGAITVVQRRLNAWVGEGVIYSLRVALFARLQRMSLRFFTNTRVGELMSRLNNDVVGAQSAVSSTIVSIITNVVQAAAVLAVMLTLQWQLTLISVAIMPFFILAARQLGGRLRDISREQLEASAEMNAMANETLNISGALLVKLFGRIDVEVARFAQRAGQVRDTGVRRTVMGTTFFVLIGLLSAMGTAFVYGIGGYMVIHKAFTIGTIVAFGSYLGSLYGSLQGLANAPVDFATSMVSFERVFEVIDLPADIEDKPGALVLQNITGDLTFDNVSFRYDVSDRTLLKDVQRFGQMDRVKATLSGYDAETDGKHGVRSEAEQQHNQAREDALEHISSQRARRAACGAGRPQRRRQNDADLSDTPPIRSERRQDHDRRSRRCRGHSRFTDGADRHGHTGDTPLPRHHSHQFALCAHGCGAR